MSNKAPIFAALLGVVTAASHAQPRVIENASFEQPKVEGRRSVLDGATPVETETLKSSWTQLYPSKKDEAPGRIVVGLTNEIARTGSQSLYVDFEKIQKARKSAVLMSSLLPVKPEQPYKISIWGRLDRNRQLTLEDR